jgi:hypothetical protein
MYKLLSAIQSSRSSRSSTTLTHQALGRQRLCVIEALG